MSTAANKAGINVQSSTSRSAGAASTDSPWIDVSTAMETTVTGKITNGATGPTVGCDFVIELADDGSGTHTREWQRLTGLTTNSFVNTWPDVPLPDTALFFRTRFSGNTGQSVTVESFASKVASQG